MKRQKRCSSEQDKNCPLFLSTPFSLTIPQSLSLTVKSLGVLLDSILSMENFISQIAKFCYYQLRRISSAQKYLSTEATVTLPWSPGSFCHALTTAVLSLLACLLPLSIAFVAYKTAARLILKKTHVKLNTSHLFQFFHWLPTEQRIQYKIYTLCYKCITNTASSYPCDCLQLYTSSRTLRSASDTRMDKIAMLSLRLKLSRVLSVSRP